MPRTLDRNPEEMTLEVLIQELTRLAHGDLDAVRKAIREAPRDNQGRTKLEEVIRLILRNVETERPMPPRTTKKSSA